MADVSIPLTPDLPESGTREGFTIVKVQVPLAGADDLALVYAHGRALKHFVPVATVADRMRGRAKAYFYATVHAGQCTLADEAPAQDW